MFKSNIHTMFANDEMECYFNVPLRKKNVFFFLNIPTIDVLNIQITLI